VNQYCKIKRAFQHPSTLWGNAWSPVSGARGFVSPLQENHVKMTNDVASTTWRGSNANSREQPKLSESKRRNEVSCVLLPARHGITCSRTIWRKEVFEGVGELKHIYYSERCPSNDVDFKNFGIKSLSHTHTNRIYVILRSNTTFIVWNIIKS
jgi:hypothetical protein